MCTKSSQTSGRLRVTQAFIALSSISGDAFEPRIISVLSIGKYEIRMFNGSPSRAGDAPSLWIELFDHSVPLSLDSCSCREIEDAVAAFDEMVSEAETLNDVWGPETDGAQA